MTREQAAKMLVSVLADMLGGDGWDDPRLSGLRAERVDGLAGGGRRRGLGPQASG